MDDKEVVMSLIGVSGSGIKAIELCSERLKNDNDVIMKAVGIDLYAYVHASDEYRANYKFRGPMELNRYLEIIKFKDCLCEELPTRSTPTRKKVMKV